MEDDSAAEEMDESLPHFQAAFRIANMLPQETSFPLQRNASLSDPDVSVSSSQNMCEYAEDEGLAISNLQKLYPHVDINLNSLPRFWSPSDKLKLIQLSSDYLSVKYLGKGSSHKDAASVRANSFIPKLCGVFYFEVRIQKIDNQGYMGIGLSEQNVSLNKIPGWDQGSYGFHADDGNFFACSGKGVEYGPTFSAGDVIGCGVNFITRCLFFTKNGVKLGNALTNMNVSKRLYPVIGMQCAGEVVDTNFGQKPFVFDFERELKNTEADIASVVSNMSLPPEKALWMNKAVAHWLCTKGYAATLQAFKAANGFQEKECGQQITQRKQIIDLITQGSLSDAMDMLQRVCPNLSKHSPELVLLLRVHQFLEAVAKTAEQNMSDECNRPSTSALHNRYKRSAPDETADQTQPKRRVNTESIANPDTPDHTNGLMCHNGESTSNGNTSTNIITELENELENSTQQFVQDKETLGRMSHLINLGQGIQSYAYSIPNLSRDLVNHMDDAFSIICYQNPLDSPKSYLFNQKYRAHLAKAVNDALLKESGRVNLRPIEMFYKQARQIRSQCFKRLVAGVVYTDERQTLTSQNQSSLEHFP